MFAIKTLSQVITISVECNMPKACTLTSHAGWSSSRSRTSTSTMARYVLEPGEYIWFLQADAALTSTAIQNNYKNESFFFEGSRNVSQFVTQMPLKPRCRNAAAMVREFPQLSFVNPHIFCIHHIQHHE